MLNYIAIIDKYYAHQPQLRQILIAHSRQVADKALAIVDQHPEWTTQGLVNRDFVEEAAMLHDIGIVLCQAEAIHCYGEHKYIEHGYLGAELLRREGLPKHAAVAERHTGTGITMEQIICEHLPMPVQDFCPRTMEEKLICYADKFYSKSRLGEEKTHEQVLRSLAKFGTSGVEIFKQWTELFE